MIDAGKKIITFCSLLIFLLASLYPALCAVMAGADEPVHLQALQPVDDEASVLTEASSKFPVSGHKKAPVLKKRPRSKRLTATILSTGPPLTLSVPVCIHHAFNSQPHLSSANLQNLSLRQLKSIVLLI